MPEVHDHARLVPEFVKLSEERAFIFDALDRVGLLARCLDRLHILSDSYRDAERSIDGHVAEQRASDPQRFRFEIPDELIKSRDDCHGESMLLVSFAYYEISALAGLLRRFFTPAPGSHLEYLIGVRNKLLVHPHRAGRTKNSDSELSVGMILHAHLLGTSGCMPVVRDFYLQKLRCRGIVLDDELGTSKNIALLRDPRRKAESFTDEERLLLKAYMIPEPDLIGGSRELADLLLRDFFPEVERVCTAVLK